MTIKLDISIVSYVCCSGSGLLESTSIPKSLQNMVGKEAKDPC